MSKHKIDKSLFSFAVLTLSDKGSQGLREDTSGPYLVNCLEEEGYRKAEYKIIGDNHQQIVAELTRMCDDGIDLIVSTGGTGVAPTDLTPEATLEVVDKLTPGISEAMRAASLLKTPHAMLSRGVSGIRGTSLIINLPGSLKAARENIEVVLPALAHGLDKINGGKSDCGVV
ncbi:MAG: MogA/MoaB family molybdenum cofactor biosynthesis protein [Desulfotalea sp.]